MMADEQRKSQGSAGDFADEPEFAAEQAHLNATYDTIQRVARGAAAKLERVAAQAAADKESMAAEVTMNTATEDDATEMWADFHAINQVIAGYNLSHDLEAKKLAACELLLRQPYFARITLRYREGAEPKELYLGTAGLSDENYKRVVVDWRSPVAEVYYNQEMGRTSYVAEGRTIAVDMLGRRQYDIQGSRLNAYFDTDVAIQDSLLLASLSHERTSQMKAITATIQKEQNRVIRADDVAALAVWGVAGSGKTSVMMQRLAYLFFQQRETLDASRVFLISPNPVFSHYISGVLPDMGERNPQTFTWDQFAALVMPEGHGAGNVAVPVGNLHKIERALDPFEFDQRDFRDVEQDGLRIVSADQAWRAVQKFANVPAGPRRVNLVREELLSRAEARIGQLAADDSVLEEIEALPFDMQIRIFDELVTVIPEEEEQAVRLRYVRWKYRDALRAVADDQWLRIDRIAMRMLGASGVVPLEWLYAKMVVTGYGNSDAQYVMIDEVQDYTAAQLLTLARYFNRAKFMTLGDANQAIKADCASAAEVESVLHAARGPVTTCELLTSYRSTPEITALFASLAHGVGSDSRDVHLTVQSVQRDSEKPAVVECADDELWLEALRGAVSQARQRCTSPDTPAADASAGLTALVVPNGYEADKLAATLGEACPARVEDTSQLPDTGVVLITLKLAKGLEFDHVIVPDASERSFPVATGATEVDRDLARRRLYTTISRATRRLTLLARGEVTPALNLG
ncbi:HelD family protein [Adlercreutzia aquisgranensis]|uniref:HelD family protein n=1 Tax=Adlercreutzia aquisgranensis TaxID=2941323 RepID=UPI002040B41A|nr:3'-5' exonuclease [Adlercreutzia aquisgranensis]